MTRINADWCAHMASHEYPTEVSAGVMAIDPVLHGLPRTTGQIDGDAGSIAFGRLISLMRRNHKLSIEELAAQLDVDTGELVEIEENVGYTPEPRTVYLMSQYFAVPNEKLSQLAGLTVRTDNNLLNEAVRFAARSESVADLKPHEKAALDAFVAILSERK